MVYKIARLFETNHHISFSESYGAVDIVPFKTGTEEEKKAVNESLLSFEYAIENKQIVKLVTILNGENLKEIIEESKIIFEDTIDLVKRTIMTEIKSCLTAGYSINMESGSIHPFLKQSEVKFNMGNFFRIKQGAYSRINSQQFIASCAEDELIKAYYRSINWFYKSKESLKIDQKFLFIWISLETISKINDTDDIVNKLLLIIGFPGNNYINQHNVNFMDSLREVKNYRIWRNRIKKHLEESRTLRNNLVHSGFKVKEINKDDIKIKIYILESIFQNLISNIELLIMSGKIDIKSAWNDMVSAIEENDNFINYFKGTFLYTLENDHLKDNL